MSIKSILSRAGEILALTVPVNHQPERQRNETFAEQELRLFNEWFMPSDVPPEHMEDCCRAWHIAVGLKE